MPYVCLEEPSSFFAEEGLLPLLPLLLLRGAPLLPATGEEKPTASLSAGLE
jgi:hypothetical protein